MRFTWLSMDRNILMPSLITASGINQVKVSRLLRGQLKEFSMTRLLVFMLWLDRDIEIRIKKHRSSRVPPSIEVLAS